MAENFDLLGDPIPDGWNKRGRPPHLVTPKNRSKVMMLLALGWKDERIANAIGVTPPTLRKHYFSELRIREEARDRLDATLADRLWQEAMAGNVGAIKEFRRIQEREDLISGAKAYAKPPAAKAPKLGKKEQAQLDARVIDDGWGGLVRH